VGPCPIASGTRPHPKRAHRRGSIEFLLISAQQPQILCPELMTKYWYRIRLSRPVKPEKVADLKGRLVRLFHGADVQKVDGRSFDLTTTLEPGEAGAALDLFCAKHGSAAFVVGSQRQQ
jgi:hypothetical protein